MKLRISVNDGDIELGEVGSADRCAIAKAIQRLFERRMVVVVADGWSGIAPWKAGTIERSDVMFSIPAHVVEWIRLFDAGEDVKPIEFEIEPIERPEAVQVAEEMAVHSTKQ